MTWYHVRGLGRAKVARASTAAQHAQNCATSLLPLFHAPLSCPQYHSSQDSCSTQWVKESQHLAVKAGVAIIPYARFNHIPAPHMVIPQSSRSCALLLPSSAVCCMSVSASLIVPWCPRWLTWMGMGRCPAPHGLALPCLPQSCPPPHTVLLSTIYSYPNVLQPVPQKFVMTEADYTRLLPVVESQIIKAIQSIRGSSSRSSNAKGKVGRGRQGADGSHRRGGTWLHQCRGCAPRVGPHLAVALGGCPTRAALEQAVVEVPPHWSDSHIQHIYHTCTSHIPACLPCFPPHLLMTQTA